MLVNAFDLVRIHRFSGDDAEAKDGTPVNRMPSYQAMKHLAMQDADVMTDLNASAQQHASDVFTAVSDNADAPSISLAHDDVNWMQQAHLEYDQNTGRPKNDGQHHPNPEF